MKALTLVQPWAWMIVYGPKRWENRTWSTTYRGPLIIHAGNSRRMMEDAYGDPTLARFLPCPSELVFSALIGIVELTRIESIQKLTGEPFAEGPWCWRLDRPIPLSHPVPMRGGRRLWNVLDGIVAPGP